MKITIGDKTYTQNKFKGRITRNLLEIQAVLSNKQTEGEFSLEDFDLINEFITSVFDNEFSTDDLLDELDFADILTIFKNIQEEISKKTNDKMSKLAKK